MSTFRSQSPSLERAFAAACKRIDPRFRRFLLGCSAGGDSMALLELAAAIAPKLGWELAVVHVDHRQRAESGDEARFVAARAAAHGLPFFLERLGDELVARGALSEDAMRQGRHACFRRAAAAFKADALMLAHQADDRAETFLIRLLAGSGPTGLAAIRPVEKIGSLIMIRPLLQIRRAALREWLTGKGLAWRDDPTNTNMNTKRGYIRHELLPAITRHIGLDPTERIAHAAELIEQEAAALTEAARLMLSQLARPAELPAAARLALDSPLWREASPSLRRQLIREWLWSLRKRPHPPGQAALEEAMAFIEHARPGAELRTIEHIHIIHLKAGLLAFAPEVEPAARRAAAAPLQPAPKPKKRRKE